MQYKITFVSGAGWMIVEWAELPGSPIIYPIPRDANGNPLMGADLDDWAARRHAADVAPRLSIVSKLGPLRGEIDVVRTARPKLSKTPVPRGVGQ